MNRAKEILLEEAGKDPNFGLLTGTMPVIERAMERYADEKSSSRKPAIKLSKETIKELSILPKHDVFFNILDNEVEIIFKTNIGSVSGDKEVVPISDLNNIDSYFNKIIKRVKEMDKSLNLYRKQTWGNKEE